MRKLLMLKNVGIRVNVDEWNENVTGISASLKQTKIPSNYSVIKSKLTKSLIFVATVGKETVERAD